MTKAHATMSRRSSQVKGE